jgi:hypothetical protein
MPASEGRKQAMLNPEEVGRAEGVIAMTQGKFFRVIFGKRTGAQEDRMMVCRTGVTKHAKGGELSYDALKMDLYPVWDRFAYDPANNDDGYRMINLREVREIQFAGQVFKFGDESK